VGIICESLKKELLISEKGNYTISSIDVEKRDEVTCKF
jgi:hypothetical protein